MKPAKNRQEMQPCRFRFPRPLVRKSCLQFTEDEKTGETRVDLVTKRNDERLNNHHRRILQIHRANMDIQAIVDSRKVVQYITKYVTKSEPQLEMLAMLSAAALARKNPTNPVKSLAKRILIHSVGRDYSAQECMHILSGMPLTLSSRSFVHLSLSGSRLLHTDDGETTLMPSALDRYCKNRPENLKDMPLFEFTRMKRFGPRGVVYDLQSECIVFPHPYVSVDPAGPHFPEYCKYFLMKYKPFRSMDDLLGGHNDYVAAYQAFTANRTIDTGLSLQQLVQDGYQRQEDQEEEDEGHAERELIMEDFAYICSRNPTYADGLERSDTCDWGKAFWDDRRFEQVGRFLQESMKNYPDEVEDGAEEIDASKMTAEQTSVYREVQNHQLAKQVDSTTPPLLKIVTGTAGTGKSFLIKCMRRLLGKCCIIAPTGVAAVNIRGQTMHSALQLPIKGETSFVDLVGDSLAGLQKRMERVEYVILDEMSMVGLRNFAMLEARFREAFPQRSDVLFGGVSFIMIGDFGQLAPIGDKPMYAQTAKTAMQTRGSLAYRAFHSATLLSRVIRQHGDEQFRELLIRVRDGVTKPEDYKLLESRFQGRVTNQADFNDAVYLFSLKEDTIIFNLDKLFSLRQPIAQLKAQHTGSLTAKNISSDDAGGLHPFSILCKGARVMLNANLWVSKGLCNGTMGIVREIVYRSSQPSSDDLPVCVLCRFPGYTGPSFSDSEECLFPVTCITRNFDHNGVHSSRTMVPLSLAWAITIHNSQGLTLPKVVLDIGYKEFSAGLTFVGMSRVRRLRDLLIHRFDRSRLTKLGAGSKMNLRKVEDLRLKELSDKGTMFTREPNFRTPDIGRVRLLLATPPSTRQEEPEEEVNGDMVEPVVLFPGKPPGAIVPASIGVCQAPDFPSISAYPPPTAATFMFQPLTHQQRRAICLRLGIAFRMQDVYGAPRTASVFSYPQQLINVTGDGHCFYHNISRALSGDENYHWTLRDKLHGFILGHRFEDVVFEDDILRRVKSVAVVMHSGTDEMVAMATMLEVSIHLFCPMSTLGGERRYKWETFNPEGTAEVSSAGIYLYACGTDLARYADPNHYAIVTSL